MRESNDDEDAQPGFCYRNKDSPFVIIAHGALFAASAISLIRFVRNQYRASNSGLYNGEVLTIFPLHLKYLQVLATVNVVMALASGIYGFGLVAGNDNALFPLIWEWTFAATMAATNSLVWSITVLLYSRAMGASVIRNSVVLGGIAFAMNAVSYYHFVQATVHGKPWASAPLSIIYLFFAYSLVALCTSLLLGLAPNSGSMQRRPAVILWNRYWGIFQIGFYTSGVLATTFDVCVCLVLALSFAFVVVFCIWFTYFVFVVDTLWWHGADTSHLDPFSRCTSGGGHQLSNLSEKVFQGVELSDSAAESLSHVRKYLKEGPTSAGAEPAKLLDFSSLSVDTSRMLGAGSTARVYRGTWRGQACAVKLLNTVEITPEQIQRTCHEASLLHSLQAASPHIVGLFGVAVTPPSVCVVLEFCSEGSLFDVVHALKEEVENTGRASTSDRALAMFSRQSRSTREPQTYKFAKRLSWEDQLQLALGACRGVEALAHTLPGFSHNDLKSANFLVNLGSVNGLTWIVKLSDVEFASKGVTPEYMIEAGTPQWTAPEILANQRPVSPASDVYALAVVLFEIESRQIPYGHMSSSDIVECVLKGKRPELPDDLETSLRPSERLTRSLFRSMVSRAWAQDADTRPSAAELTANIEEIWVAFTRDQRSASATAANIEEVVRHNPIREDSGTHF